MDSSLIWCSDGVECGDLDVLATTGTIRLNSMPIVVVRKSNLQASEYPLAQAFNVEDMVALCLDDISVILKIIDTDATSLNQVNFWSLWNLYCLSSVHLLRQHESIRYLHWIIVRPFLNLVSQTAGFLR